MQNKKIESKDEIIEFNPGQTGTKSTQEKIDAIQQIQSISKKQLNLVVNPKITLELEKILVRFKEVTEAYFTYPTKVQLFETGCYFLEEHFANKGEYHIAPKAFLKNISRKGKRPQTEQTFERKGNPKPFYISIDQNAYDIYFNLIFSFLKKKKDLGNSSYSAPYFFKDFVDLLNDNFKGLTQYELNNPRD